jgi:hypothetical protein
VSTTAWSNDKAIEHARKQPDATVWRYVETDGTVEADVAVLFVLNTVFSRTPLQYQMFALDKKTLAFEIPRELIKTWELYDDPYHSAKVAIKVAPYKASDGKTYSHKTSVVYINPLINELAVLTASNAPILDHRFFIKKSLTTLDGGLYYKLRDIPATQAEFLQKFNGVSEADISALRAEAKQAVFFSKVTAKPRVLLVFRGPNGKVDTNQGLVRITQDPADNAVDPKEHPIRNLLAFKYAATEIITEMPNGYHVYGLFDGEGRRQDAAPDNIVKDHLIPAPYTARLQPAISCIRCHGPEDGVQRIGNDVLKFRPSGKNLDELDRIYSMYSGDLSKPLQRSRDDYSDVIAKLGISAGVKEQLLTVPKASAIVSKIHDNYVYDRIDIAVASKESNVDISKIVTTDPVLLALQAGLSISRLEWEQVYVDVKISGVNVIDNDGGGRIPDTVSPK